MFCPKCGTKNEDSAEFCINCGNAFNKATPTTGVPAQPPNVPAPPSQKNPIVAAILNFFLPGIGYWYWGYRKVVTVPPLLLFIGVVILESLIWIFVSYAGVVNFLINLFFAYDVYVKAKGQRGWIEASM